MPSETELIMAALDAELNTSGVEAIWGEGSCTWPVATYCNAGDTYSPTILHDAGAGRFRLTTYGDWVERNEKRLGIA
jgi:hypothetical protein